MNAWYFGMRISNWVIAEELWQTKRKGNSKGEMGWRDVCGWIILASVCHLPQHDKFSFVHRASTPLLFVPAATAFSQTSSHNCCCVVLHPTHSFPPLLHAAFCMTCSGNFICPPAYTMEALQALLLLRFQCPRSTASSFFFPSLALSLHQLGCGLTLLHGQRVLKLLLCLSCQQFSKPLDVYFGLTDLRYDWVLKETFHSFEILTKSIPVKNNFQNELSQSKTVQQKEYKIAAECSH